MLAFTFNNLAVLLTVLAIASIVGYFWACHTLKTGKTHRTGRFFVFPKNRSNKPMATKRVGFRDGFLR